MLTINAIGAFTLLACATGFQHAQLMPLTTGQPISARLPTAATSKISMATLDRRSALRVGSGALVWGLGNQPPHAAAAAARANNVDLNIAEQVKVGVKKICTGGSQPVPAEELTVGVIDDGSPLMAAAKLGVAAAGAKCVALKGSVAEIQDKYYSSACNACVVRNINELKKVNAGKGLNCAGCSYSGGEGPPSWFIVMESNGKTDTQLQSDAQVTGRECSKETPGVCFQIGIAIPVYAYDLLPVLKIETREERPPCTGRFEGVC